MADNIESRKRNGIPPRETTRRTIDLVTHILKRAQQKGLIDDVASKHLRNEYPKLKSEHFKYLDLPNLPALLKDIDNYTGDIQTRLGMQFLAYTFYRNAFVQMVTY